ncbi:MAG: arginine--tRNA ligase [Acidobacteriota bacterium]
MSALDHVASALREAITTTAREALGVELEEVPLTEPPEPKLGDFACSACLPLAKTLRRAPRQIAESLVEALPPIEGVARLEIAGPGYINAYLDRPKLAAALLAELEEAPAPPRDVHEAPRVDASRPKVIVEHTNINPNKAAHVGHLRNAVLGDSLVRLLQHSGQPVEVQNYIDDTGVQVADVVVGFTAFSERNAAAGLAEVERLMAAQEEGGRPFDHECWDLYSQVTQWYEADEERLTHRKQALHEMEEGESELAKLGHVIATAIVKRHLATMARIGVGYHLLPWEGDVLAAEFWQDAFARLKESGAIHLAEDGKNAGCWVMPLADSADFADEKDPDKILVRSNGTVTYTGKDIALQMWKFGLLDSDFRYRVFAEDERAKLWTSDTDGGSAEGHPEFGKGGSVYNVIDVRQSYPQKVVKNALALLGHAEAADGSTHYSYEMVALTPRTAEALGFEITEEERKASHVEMSGRRGIGVKADDLLDRLASEASEKVRANADITEDELAATAAAVAVGALRYFMLKFTRNSLIAFDIESAVQFQGEAGPYLQYTTVRTANVFRKLAEEGHDLSGSLVDELQDAGDFLEDDLVWTVLMNVARLPTVVQRSVDTLELAPIAKHGFQLCQSFNKFYGKHSLLHAETDELRRGRAAVARTFLLGQRQVLGLLGLPEPERM